MTGFLSILNQMDIHVVQNRKETCPYDHIPFNVKGNGIQVFSVLACGAFFESKVQSNYSATLQANFGIFFLRKHAGSCAEVELIFLKVYLLDHSCTHEVPRGFSKTKKVPTVFRDIFDIFLDFGIFLLRKHAPSCTEVESIFLMVYLLNHSCISLCFFTTRGRV